MMGGSADSAVLQNAIAMTMAMSTTASASASDLVPTSVPASGQKQDRQLADCEVSNIIGNIIEQDDSSSSSSNNDEDDDENDGRQSTFSSASTELHSNRRSLQSNLLANAFLRKLHDRSSAFRSEYLEGRRSRDMAECDVPAVATEFAASSTAAAIVDDDTASLLCMENMSIQTAEYDVDGGNDDYDEYDGIYFEDIHVANGRRIEHQLHHDLDMSYSLTDDNGDDCNIHPMGISQPHQASHTPSPLLLTNEIQAFPPLERTELVDGLDHQNRDEACKFANTEENRIGHHRHHDKHPQKPSNKHGSQELDALVPSSVRGPRQTRFQFYTAPSCSSEETGGDGDAEITNETNAEDKWQRTPGNHNIPAVISADNKASFHRNMVVLNTQDSQIQHMRTHFPPPLSPPSLLPPPPPSPPITNRFSFYPAPKLDEQMEEQEHQPSTLLLPTEFTAADLHIPRTPPEQHRTRHGDNKRGAVDRKSPTSIVHYDFTLSAAK